MANEERLIKIYPKQLLAQIDNKLYKLSLFDKFTIKLTSWDYIEISEDIFLFVNRKGFVLGEKQSDGKLKTKIKGDWNKLLQMSPEMITFLSSEAYRDLNFIKNCYISATKSLYTIINHTKVEIIRNAAIKRKNNIRDLFAVCIENALEENRETDKLLKKAEEDEKEGWLDPNKPFGGDLDKYLDKLEGEFDEEDENSDDDDSFESDNDENERD